MKKFFKKALVMLSIVGMGLTTSSCDTEVLKHLDWTTLIGAILNNIFTGGATSNVYQGTYTLQHLVTDGNGKYNLESEKLTFDGTGCTVQKGNNNTVNLVLPGTDGIGEATMTDIKVYNLMFVKDEKTGTVTNQVDLPEEGATIDGKLTIDNVEYDATNMYIKCTVTDQKMVIEEASIYFGDNYEHAINVTFNGDIVVKDPAAE